MRRKNCRSRKSWLLTVGALLLAASVGFGVPLAFRKWQDDRRLSVVETEEAPEVRITSQTELSMVEKAELFLSADASTTVLEKGKNYDVAGSLAKAEEELATLCEMGVLDETFRTAKMTEQDAEQSADPIFYIDPSGEKSMIIWMLNFQIDTEWDRWILKAALDDETGKLLELGIQEWSEDYGNGIRSGAAATDSDMAATDSDTATADSDVAERAQKFGSYLGLTTERVTQNWELADAILSDGDRTAYDNQVHLYEKKGYTEEEARRLVSEEWGISDRNPDGSRTAQVVYREGDKGEVHYYLRLGALSLSIYFAL
ncbi:hypothetical protein [Laedolimicola intestinihominis]|uniref:Uncharacterized protein n=1 Tax=Laedolimicola intestinihominis TaxID=3133166 RepID=A0ABV1FDD9_9FIRM